jgi:large subunit ribosomal protein L5
MKSRLVTTYKEKIVPKLREKFGYKNIHEVPRLVMIVVNIGTGRADKDAKLGEAMLDTMRRITGQQPSVRKARKAISAFKVRLNQSVGLTVTLRGNRMYEFLDKLVNVTLPRVRDFRGINPKSFDGRGNYSFGLKDQNVFPEVPFEQVEKTHGLQITVRTTAKTDPEGRALLEGFGMPFGGRDFVSQQEVTSAEDRASLLAHAKAKAARTTVSEA